MKSLLIGCILACLHLCSNAQSSFISGVLLDNETREAIPYATIAIKEKQEGTLSNAEGKFSLLIKDFQNQDRLTISCVGFETISLSVAELAGSESHSIYLKSKTFTLDDAIVTNQSIPSLLEEAIHTTQAFIPAKQYYEAYYKELAYLDKELYKFSDAAVNYVINDEGRKTKADLYILESRIKQDSISDDEKWRSDIESLIDPQKAVKDFYNLNYLKKFISKKGLEKFNFTSEQNGQLLKITVNPKTEIRQYLPNGVVYVDTETKRIIRVDYNYISHLKYMPKVNLLVLAMSFEENLATVLYDEGEKAFLRYCNISQEVHFKVGKKKGLLGSKAEILFHSLQEETPESLNKSYSKINIYRSGNNFTTDFWKNRNSLMLTQSEIEILGSILNKNN